MSKYFLSFIEEFWTGQREGTWIGRIEYQEEGAEQLYPDEIGFGTEDREAVERLREKYDLQTVDEETWQEILKEVERLKIKEDK